MEVTAAVRRLLALSGPDSHQACATFGALVAATAGLGWP